MSVEVMEFLIFIIGLGLSLLALWLVGRKEYLYYKRIEKELEGDNI